MSTTSETAELRRRVDELQQQLLQAQRLTTVGELASSITHEFNNILTTVINYAKIGLRNPDTAARDKAFDKILAAGQRASRITTGLLGYARRGVDRREPTDLRKLIQDVLVLVEKDLEHHRVRLEADFAHEPVDCDVNAGQIQQVALNLIVNARQAMSGGGGLFVAVRTDAERLHGEIVVRDSGCGIAPETLRKIFEPFFTTKQVDAKGQGGTGLGLSMCRDVVEAHHGRIRVESQVGKGTTFCVVLPLATGGESSSPAAAVMAKRAISASGGNQALRANERRRAKDR